jgi:hypothetical protein
MLPFDDASIPPPPLDAQYGYEPRKLERSRVARRIARLDAPRIEPPSITPDSSR